MAPPPDRPLATHTYESVFIQLFTKLDKLKPGYSWARATRNLNTGVGAHKSDGLTDPEARFRAERDLWEHYCK